MAQYPMLPLWTDAYLADTSHLTTIEHGAYFLLLVAMWRNKGSLPDDDKMLARYTRMTPKQWERIKKTIMPFFQQVSGKLTQSRLTDEYNAVKQLSDSQSRKARVRWLKSNDTDHAEASAGQCPGDASPTHSPDPTQKEEKLVGAPSGAPPTKDTSDGKRGTRLPIDWQPTTDHVEWAARECGLDVARVHAEADGFRDYWRAETGAKASKRDWNAAFRTWLRRASNTRKPNGTGRAPPRHDLAKGVEIGVALGRARYGYSG